MRESALRSDCTPKLRGAIRADMVFALQSPRPDMKFFCFAAIAVAQPRLLVKAAMFTSGMDGYAKVALRHAKAEHDKNLNEDSWPCSHWCPTARIGSRGQKRAPNSASSARCRLRFAGHKISRVTPCCPLGVRPGNLDRVFRGNLRGPEEASLQNGPDHGQSRRLRQGIPAQVLQRRTARVGSCAPHRRSQCGTGFI